MDYRDTPVFITSFNRAAALRQLVDWLLRAEAKDITIIDNASTYGPLLRYYDSLPRGVTLVESGANLGHQAFWLLGLQNSVATRFIVTDPDVVPDKDCPLDLVRKMHEVADRYAPAKVGPAIRIDNLPDHYAKKELMLRSECGYWDESRRLDAECFEAAIDTTFALYEPGWGAWPAARHVRLDFPYVVEHLPWHSNSSEPDEERDYYAAHVLPGISHS